MRIPRKNLTWSSKKYLEIFEKSKDILATMLGNFSDFFKEILDKSDWIMDDYLENKKCEFKTIGKF